MNETPDGGRCVGEARGYAEASRKNGMVPLIAGPALDRARIPREWLYRTPR